MFYKHGRLIVSLVLIALVAVGLANWEKIFWQLEFFVFERAYPTQIIYADLDGDNKAEMVKILKRREYSFGEMCSESILCILRKGARIWEPILIDRFVGEDILKHEIRDINDDGYCEFLSWWTARGRIRLYIYQWNGERCKQLFCGYAKDIKLGDVDSDGTEEIFEYFERFDRSSEVTAQMYRWENMEYMPVKADIPVVTDPLKGDQLLLGRGKIAVLK